MNIRHILALSIITFMGIAPTCQDPLVTALVTEPTPTFCPSGSFVDINDPIVEYNLETVLGKVDGSVKAIHDHICTYSLAGDSDGPGDSIVWVATLTQEEVAPGSEDPTTCCESVEFTGTVSESCNRIDGLSTSVCSDRIKERQITLVR